MLDFCASNQVPTTHESKTWTSRTEHEEDDFGRDWLCGVADVLRYPMEALSRVHAHTAHSGDTSTIPDASRRSAELARLRQLRLSRNELLTTQRDKIYGIVA